MEVSSLTRGGKSLLSQYFLTMVHIFMAKVLCLKYLFLFSGFRHQRRWTKRIAMQSSCCRQFLIQAASSFVTGRTMDTEPRALCLTGTRYLKRLHRGVYRSRKLKFRFSRN